MISRDYRDIILSKSPRVMALDAARASIVISPRLAADGAAGYRQTWIRLSAASARGIPTLNFIVSRESRAFDRGLKNTSQCSAAGRNVSGEASAAYVSRT